MSKWIKVEDGLPEDGVQVLFYHHFVVKGFYSSRYHGRGYFETAWLDDADFTGEGVRYKQHFDVTHWQPLPEKPEDE